MIPSLLIVFVIVASGNGQQQEGSQCFKDDRRGVCRNIEQCPSAIRGIANKILPKTCFFQGSTPVVCCFDDQTSRPVTRPTPTYTSTRSPTSATRPSTDSDCEPLPPEYAPNRTGRKAWDKCIEYQSRYVYPCEKSVAFTGGNVRGSHCGHNVDELVVGGEDAKPKEFPHMALLGFGDDAALAEWLCGGSVISERYVLTAGHCTSTSRNVPVSYVRTGVLKRSEPLDLDYVYRIEQIIKHPDYNPPMLYNDIALLRTRTDMYLSQFVVPACLPTDSSHNDAKAIATGFGALRYRGKNADNLQKVNLTKFSNDECSEQYDGHRLLKEGVSSRTQLCFGDKNAPRDTCQGDSGGPLQIRNSNVRCMYTVVGVTSHGENCGVVGLLALYTRVLAYTPWIESVVWSN